MSDFNFICRICGGNSLKYECIKEDGIYSTYMYICNDCGVIFSDPYKFTLPILEFRVTDEEKEIEKTTGIKWQLPKKHNPTDSGFDICSSEKKTLTPGESYLFKTGICAKVPKGFEIQVRPRSGLSKKLIFIPNSPGTIDETYRGEIGVILFNNSNEWQDFEKGDKIAQLVFCKTYHPNIEENNDEINKFKNTDRSDKGFGSSGK